MRSSVEARDTASEASPWKLLLWTAVAGLVFGLIGFGEIAEDWLRVARNGFHRHEASGNIVLVKIDDQSIREIGRWPWPRSNYARLTDDLTKAGAKRIFFDLTFVGPTNPSEDEAFAKAIERSGRVTSRQDAVGTAARIGARGTPLPSLAKHARLGTISVNYNYQNAAWHLPFALPATDGRFHSFSAELADVTGPSGKSFHSRLFARSLDNTHASGSDVIGHNSTRRAFAGRMS